MDTLQITRCFLLLTLHWIPRILSILFIILLTLFSFDVFDNTGFWKTLTAFLVHLVPSIVLIGILLLSWKRSWVGGISFIILGVCYLYWFPNAGKYIIIYLPLFVSGILFSLDWLLRKQIKSAQEAWLGETGM